MKINLQKLKTNKSIQELLEFGIVNIDKPSGPTSFGVSESVKKMLGLRKTSHFGTLDPKVTGVLPVALNRACKLTGYFIGKDKEYVGIMRIHKEIPLEKIKKTIKKKFTGVIKQTPPVKSRVKRQEREREIKRFEILEKDGKDILFKVECAAGTYIRKLIHDLGEELDIGAHMLELRRTRAGIFSEDDKNYPCVNLYDFEKVVKDEKKLKKIIIPGEVISEIYPVVKIKEKYIGRMLHGPPINNNFLNKKAEFKKDDIVCVFSKDKFIGMYRTIKEKNIFAKPEFVMQPIRK